MEKHQIAILGGIGVIVIFIIASLFMGGGSDDESDIVNDDTALPTVPEAEKKGYSTKVAEFNAERKNRELPSSKDEKIDLDVFGLDKKEQGIPKEEPKEPVKKNVNTSKRKPIRRSKPRQRNVVQEQETTPKQEVKKEVDPDLMFFTEGSGGGKTTYSDDIIISGVIHEQVTIVQGKRITLRVTKDVLYQGKRIKKNSFILATANVSGNRVSLDPGSIKYADGSTVLVKKLEVYDGNDGKLGLYSLELLENQQSQQTTEEVIDEVEGLTGQNRVRDIIGGIGKAKIRERAVVLKRNHPIIIK